MRLNKGTETQTEAKEEQIIRPASKTDARKKQTYLYYFKNQVDG
jgi:hypothetical protein